MTKTSRWLSLFSEFTSELRIPSKELVSDDPRGSPLVLWDSQKRFMKEVAEGLDNGIHDFYCLKSRQLGVTTISIALVDVFWMAMHPNMIGALVSDTEKNRDANRMLIETYVKSIPEDYFGDFRIVKANRQFIQYSNGSRLDLLVAGTKDKGTSWGEGVGYSIAHLTECAAYGSQDAIKSFREALAQKHPNRLFVAESTAKGFNHWRDDYKQGLNDPYTKKSFFIGWWAADNNRIERKDPRFLQYNYPASGEERERVVAVAHRYGHAITPEQLAWIRWKGEQAGGDEDDMLRQNQPWCLIAGTRVGTKRGVLPIEEIVAGDETGFGRVLAAGPTGVSPLWRARTALGYEVVGTPNHPLIDADGNEVQIQHALGATVRLAPPVFADEPYTHRWTEGVVECAVRITPEIARLVGIFMGDGSMAGSPRSGYNVAITCDSKDEDLICEIERLFMSIFGVVAHRSVYRSVGNGGWTNLRATSKEVFDTFVRLGLSRNDTGPTMRRIHVPEFIWRSPRDVVREFLAGLFEADGYCSDTAYRVVFSSSYSPSFVQDVQLLLLGFGITSKTAQTQPKIKRTGKSYYATRMELRRSEAQRFVEEIGFLSARKRAKPQRNGVRPAHRMGRKPTPIVFEDSVVEVEPTGAVETVYNLTVEGRHWFEANGIVTHNTDDDAFIVSGFSFFQTREIHKQLKQHYDRPDDYGFQAYKYEVDGSFFDMKMVPAQSLDEVDLKVWEEPVEGGRYVIGMDPAWGRNDWSDRSAISVWRCYADCMVQVAEFASADLDVSHAAWVCAHLAGAYDDVIINVEVTGGAGHVVMKEWEHVRELMNTEIYDKVKKDRNWDNALGQARWYLYSRPDSMGKGYAANFETSGKSKERLMFGFRSEFIRGGLHIKSVRLLEEMRIVVQNGREIAAPQSSGENSKDDRVIASALACIAWTDWVRPGMLAEGLTYEAVVAKETGNETKAMQSVNGIVFRFLKTQEEIAAEGGYVAPTWREEQGLE